MYSYGDVMEEVKVSIICNTYNQEDYIEDALRSFLSQDTNFSYEVLVHDDASTDRTPEIIRSYASDYPDIVKPYYETVNQYTVEDRHNFLVQSARVTGSYVAICEGDDYWTDDHKLQQQYDVLEEHSELDICTHASEMVRSDNGRTVGMVRPRETSCVIPVEDVIMGGGSFVMTNSIFMRAETYVHPPQILRDFNIDYLRQITGAMRGGMYYIDKCMSAYRVGSVGSWSQRVVSSRVRTLSFWQKVIDALEQLDEQTDFAYSEPLQKHIDELMYSCHIYRGEFSEAWKTQKWQDMNPLGKARALPGIVLDRLFYKLDEGRQS